MAQAPQRLLPDRQDTFNVSPECFGMFFRISKSITGARSKRRGFSPGAAARPLDRTRAREDSAKRGVSWENYLNRGVSCDDISQVR